MKKNGFTLIELVVVIVILGVLAVTAAPRFLNLQSDARNAALEGLKGALESGLSLGYSALAINGLEDESYINAGGTNPTTIPIDGCSTRCIFRYGYPESDWYTLSVLVDGINKDYEQTKDWGITKIGGTGPLIITDKSNLVYNGSVPTLVNSNCYVRYTQATSSNSYSLDLVACP